MAISVTTCFWSTCYIYSSCQIIQRRLLGPVFIFDSVCEKIRFQMINVNKRRRKKNIFLLPSLSAQFQSFRMISLFELCSKKRKRSGFTFDPFLWLHFSKELPSILIHKESGVAAFQQNSFLSRVKIDATSGTHIA